MKHAGDVPDGGRRIDHLALDVPIRRDEVHQEFARSPSRTLCDIDGRQPGRQGHADELHESHELRVLPAGDSPFRVTVSISG
jgi:hypothetical protein